MVGGWENRYNRTSAIRIDRIRELKTIARYFIRRFRNITRHSRHTRYSRDVNKILTHTRIILREMLPDWMAPFHYSIFPRFYSALPGYYSTLPRLYSALLRHYSILSESYSALPTYKRSDSRIANGTTSFRDKTRFAIERSHRSCTLITA